MQFTSETVERGVAERAFSVEVDDERVPGILWRPADATGPTPLVLIGHGGTQHKRTPNVLGLARRFVRHLGYSAVALDAPGHGDRVVDPEAAERARADLERWVTTSTGQGGAHAEATQRPWGGRDRGLAEWSGVLDVCIDAGIADERVGYWGVSMGTVIGLPFVAGEPRVKAAVLGLACLADWPGAEEREAAARRLACPVLFVLQWDDQLFSRASGLALFDAIGSQDKALHVFPGGHVETPLYERDAFEAFYVRHLGRGAEVSASH